MDNIGELRGHYMKKILLTNRYQNTPLEIINSVVPSNFELLMLPELSQRTLVNMAPKADYILASGRLRIDADVLLHAPKLCMIQRTGVGLDSLDLDAIRQRNIPLYVNQGVNAESAAEHTLLLIMSCLRHLPAINANTKAGIWKKQEQGTQTRELHGKTIGIIGMGNIAKHLVTLLDGFGVTVLYNSKNKPGHEFETAHRMHYVEKEELFRKADIITLHCPLTDETRAMINKESIHTMKDGVIIVNTARGQIINTSDLADALKSGKVGYAGIDVHEEEPFSDQYPLKNCDNAILTPHIAGITYESFFSMMHDAMRNIELYDKGEYGVIEQYRYL